MAKSNEHEVSRLLDEIESGASPAVNELLPLVYEELHSLARRYFRDERAGHTLQPTALVHEAYLRLVDQTRVSYHGRSHFFAVAAKMMRRVLVDYARRRARARRGGGRKPLTFESDLAPAALDSTRLIELDDAIDRLAALDERQGRVVELRFFGGMSVEEVAEHLGVSKRSIEDDWTHAKAWLRVQFGHEALR